MFLFTVKMEAECPSETLVGTGALQVDEIWGLAASKVRVETCIQCSNLVDEN